MRLAVTLLGLDLLTVEITTDDDDEPGDSVTTALGFTLPASDTEWQPGVQRQ